MAARGRLRSRNILKYSAYGLTISSEFPLPELLPCVGPSKPQIFIRKGRLPSTRRGVGNSLRATARTADFFWKGESAIRVSNGEEITVDTFPGADEKAVRLSILGPAFFQLLVQKKFFVLHASAVNVNGKAVAFVGGSGAGKSTLTGRLIALYRAQKLKVGVLMVDPSSSISGGAFLGDRLRVTVIATGFPASRARGARPISRLVRGPAVTPISGPVQPERAFNPLDRGRRDGGQDLSKPAYLRVKVRKLR